MKIVPFLLMASVAGNLALAFLIVTGTAPGVGNPKATSSDRSRVAAENSTANPRAAGDVDAKTWNVLSQGDDEAALVTRLRAQGFPPAVVRAIVLAQINEAFAARRKAITPPKSDTPYWQGEKPADPRTQAALRELAREQSKRVKELLGSGARPDEDPVYAAFTKRRLGNISPEKVDQIMTVQRDYGELMQDLYRTAGMGGGAITFTADDRAKMALLEKEQRADIQRLLTPQEFEDYELRSSNTASSLRYQLSAFAPNEQEFRTIFALQRDFDEQNRLQAGEATAPETARQRAEAQKQQIAKVAAALGPERGADYERAMDNNFRQIHNVVSRLELPQETAVEVWALQKDIEQRTRALRSDEKLAGPARQEQMAALADEAMAKLTAALGQRGVEVYRQNGGYWLQNLQSRTTAAGAAAPTPAGGEIIYRP
jgi:hypothetical protein